MGILIRDGYTLEGLIPARPGLHGELRFSYRPALPERVVEYLRADKSTAAKEVGAAVKLLGEHLVSWDAEEPLTPEGAPGLLRRLPHPVLTALVDHVTGYSATDWAAREKN